MEVFSLQRPSTGETPVLVEVPHAGWNLPERVLANLNPEALAVRRDSDIFVDQLYRHAPEVGASLLVAHVSRYVVDLNRSHFDVDAETVPDHPDPRGVQPRGVVWRISPAGKDVLKRPLSYEEFQDRIGRFHTPYHHALQEELDRKRGIFGYVILLAAHSMPSGGALRGFSRADIVPGTRGRTSADGRVIDTVDAFFRSRDYSVRHDEPYRGGWTTGHYGRPEESCHAVQIELNRALYVNEASSEPKPTEFALLTERLTELVRQLGQLRLSDTVRAK